MHQSQGIKFTPCGHEVDVEDRVSRQGYTGRILYGGFQVAVWSSNPFLRQNMNGRCSNEAEAMAIADQEIGAGRTR